ncbi:MAG: hypothetical protein U0230_14890 [Polyangiales bacterium]
MRRPVAMPPTLPRTSLFVLALVLASCDACEEPDHRVPYRAGEPATISAPGTPSGAPTTTPGFTSVRSVRVAPGTTELVLDGQKLAYGGFEIVATLTSDFDRDGDADLLVLLGSQTEQAIGFARRDGRAFVQTLLTRTMRRPDCEDGPFEARTLSPDLAVVERTTICAGSEERELLPMLTHPEPQPTDGVRVFAATADTPWVERASLEAGAEDVDGDGTSDLVVTVKVVPRGLPETHTKLVWPNLPSGLALDRSEPGKTLLAMTRDARRFLGQRPARAAERSGQALALASAICREHGVAVVGTQVARGLPCGAIPSLGRLLAIRVAALLGRGSLAEAHEALRTANALGIRIDADNLRLVTDAIAATSAAPAVTWTSYGEITPGNLRSDAATLLSFEADDALVVRGPAATRFKVGDPSFHEPAPDVLAPIVDPTGARSAIDVRTGCRGDVVSLGGPDGRASGASLGLSQVAPFDPAIPCEAGTARGGDPGGRYTLLGWTTDGVVVALGGKLFVAPLDASSHPTGPLVERAPGALGGESRGGSITPDGRSYALSLEHAVVVREAEGRFVLLRGEPWMSGDGPVRALALAPSGRTLALVRGRTLWIGTW